MAPVMEKRNGRKAALRISLVGQNPEFRAEVRQVLMALSEPPLEIAETTPAPLPAAPEAKPADVAMVLFNGTEEP